MFEKIRRTLNGAASQRDDARSRTLYHWRCACGAHSRGPGGWLITYDAEYNARRHMWREGVGHPMPDVYSTEEKPT